MFKATQLQTVPLPSPIPKKFLGYVTLNDPFRLCGFPFLLLLLLFLMPFEVLNILRMNQILDLDIRPTMVFLPMVNLIFVFVVAMVSRPIPQIGHFHTLCICNRELGVGDCVTVVRVEEGENLLDRFVLLIVRNMRVGSIVQAVQALDVVG